MLVYSTEFPLSAGKRASDIFEIYEKWLTGSPHYPFFGQSIKPFPENDIITIENSGHTVKLAHVDAENGCYLGIRHQHRQDDFEWATEVTTKISSEVNYVSVKIFCDSLVQGKEVPTPKKPHIVKLFINGLGGGLDGDVKIDDKPYYLVDKTGDLDHIKAVIRGSQKANLPIIFISVDFNGYPIFDAQSLSYWLSGMAHVFVEPSRRFSVKLSAQTNSQNCYGGAACIYWPGGFANPEKIVANRFPSIDEAQKAIVLRIKEMATYVKNKNAASWLQVKDLLSEYKINKLKSEGSGNVDEYIREFDSQNAALRAQLEEANAAITNLRASNQGLQRKLADGPTAVFLSVASETEFYPNEFKDIVIGALKSVTVLGDGTRPKQVVNEIISSNEISSNPEQLEMAIREAFGNYTKFGSREASALEAIGFEITDDGKHVKAVYNNDPRYTFTLPKTPSDHRSIKNCISDITKKLVIK